LGLRRDIRLLREKGSLSVLTERSIMPPRGVVGGRAGAANTFTVLRDGDAVETSPIPGKIADFALRADDVVRMETSGGGGFGDPLKRDPERVRADVEHAYISREQGERRYGVVLADDGDVDVAATEAKRESLRDERVEASLEVANEELRDGPRRTFQVPKALARRLGVEDGGLVELSTGRGAAVRGWVRVGEAEEGDWLRLGPSGLDLLAAAPGDSVEVRAVQIAVP
jgi:N-methylhydantoinase B